MICSICEQFEKLESLVTGCSNFRIDSLSAHERSETHKKCLSGHIAKTKPKGTPEGEKAVVLKNKAAVDKLKILFRNAHYIAKAGRPYTDYRSLCGHGKAQGLDVGETYLTDKYCQKFVTVIAKHRREIQRKIVNQSPFLSIISDGSTDTSSTEAEIVYMKVLNKCQMQATPSDFRKESSAKARNFLKLLKDESVITWLHLTMDIVKCLNFGDQTISHLVHLAEPALKAYNDDVEVDEIESEWTRLKTSIADSMKMVKNDWRSRLGDANLSDLMLICIEEEPVERFDTIPAIEKWYAGGLRA
ncbi:unnamed protein product [Mytilus coruscus]|uniref:C17orf113 probable zinc finger domain-containing protein n=1 Tax=Mytilus coruscus TaxID=42192 RepID=A0A6J8EA22_MYTCO|nr:unnamed protein product [Mytilus coruscus]